MRKFTFLLSFLFVVLGLSAQTNLVQNPSFESDFANWTKGPTSSYTAPTIVSSGAQDGSKFAQYAGATATTGFYQDIPVAVGKTYIVSFWYKASGDDTDARIWSIIKDAEGKYIYTTPDATTDPLRNNNGYLPTATEWTKHEVTFTVPANAVSLQLAVRAYSGATASFDNFSLVESGVVTPVLSVNPSVLSFSGAVGSSSAPQTITVSGTNLSSSPTVAISGTDAAMFSQTGTLTVSGGELSVVFTPTSSGTKTATLTLTSGTNTATVELSGSASDDSNPYGLDDSAPVNALNEPFGDGTVTARDLPSGWVSHALQSSDRNWEVRNYSSNNYAQMTAHNGTGTYQTMLISPAINFDAIEKSTVKFDWNSGYTNGAELKVYVMSKDGSKTLVKTINDNKNPSGYGTGFTTETLDLSTYSGVKFLAFEYNGTAPTSTSTYQVDNVVATIRTGLFSNKLESISLRTSSGKIYFNASAGETVEVYNTMGQKVYNALATDGDNEISVSQKGIAIVKVGNRTGKVVL